MRRAWIRPAKTATIESRIRWLVIACVLPAWLFAVAVIHVTYARERDALASTTAQSAELMIQAVDRELATGIAVLQTLADSTLIDAGDFGRFERRASQVMQRFGADNVLLLDPQLRGLAAANRPFGPVMPALQVDRFPLVMPTGQPGVSDLYLGSISGKLQIALAVPVQRGETAVLGRLEMILSPDRFGQVLGQHGSIEGWTAVLVDGAGKTVAQVPANSGLPGTTTGVVLPRELQGLIRGSFHSRNADGVGMIQGFARSASHGWMAVVGVRDDVLIERLSSTLMWSAAGALALLAAALVLASLIGRRIARPVQALVGPASAVGCGEAPELAPTTLREAAEVGAALQDAHRLLREREEARAQAEALMRDSQDRLRVALDASRIGDWDLDLRTGVLLHSLRHDQCFGYPEQLSDWSVEHFAQHVHPDDRERVLQNVTHALEVSDAWRQDCRVIWPDGSVHWLHTLGSVLRKEGVPYRLTGIVIDITERKQNEALRLQQVRLEAENQQILESNRLKSEFLANMSHELRTPLNAVIGFADILRSGAVAPDSPKREEYLGHIATSGRHLLKLINDVLDLSKVESGKFEFFPEPVNLPRLICEVVGVLEAEAGRKSVDLVSEVEPGPSDPVLDPARLKQILYNLLSNAIKFSSAGGRVILRAGMQGTDHLRIEVEDFGIGISAADQSRLFAPFQQVNAGHARQHQGTGLGLALTRRLVELQGGAVGLRSELGAGSVFSVTLPIRPLQAALPALPLSEPTVWTAGPRVLVIEDDAADQAKLVKFLAAAGFQADLATNGEQALQKAASQRYEAITLDLLLPDRSGLEVLSLLREGDANRDVPVVVITMVTETSALRGFQISDILAKPIRAAEVVGALRRAGLRSSSVPSVMVVDDDPAAAELMAATLQSIGVTPICMADGHSALASLDEHRPDAMVLDLLMPGLNGFEVLRALRQRPDYLHLPVFVWTSLNLTPEEEAALARSACTLAGKGAADWDQLVEQLRVWRAGRQLFA